MNKDLVIISLVTLLVILMGGCSTSAGIAGGAASYDYERSMSDGTYVKISIKSARNLDSATLVVTPEGGLVAKSDNIDGTEATSSFTKTIRSLLSVFLLPP